MRWLRPMPTRCGPRACRPDQAFVQSARPFAHPDGTKSMLRWLRKLPLRYFTATDVHPVTFRVNERGPSGNPWSRKGSQHECTDSKFLNDRSGDCDRTGAIARDIALAIIAAIKLLGLSLVDISPSLSTCAATDPCGIRMHERNPQTATKLGATMSVGSVDRQARQA